MTAGFDPPPPPGASPGPGDPPVPSAPPPPPGSSASLAPVPPCEPMARPDRRRHHRSRPRPQQPGWVPPAAARRRRRAGSAFAGWSLGVIAVIAAVLGYQYWDQQQNYKAGHEAYLAADCAAAIVPLRKAADGSGDTATQAEAELQECQALLDGSDRDHRRQPVRRPARLQRVPASSTATARWPTRP